MKYDYWKMRGWTLVKNDTMRQPPAKTDDDDNFTSVDDVVKSIDDIFEILQEQLAEGNPFIIEIDLEEKNEDKEESKDDAYDRAMKGL